MDGLSQFLSLHWKTILEMVIISGGLYLAYRFLRPVGGARVLWEMLVLLLALTLVAHALNLELIKTFLLFTFLGLVIIFQPELRHAFVTLMGDRLFRPAQNMRELVEQLGDAVQTLSSKRFGALFAIERGMDLKQFLETGVVIDSKFSPALVLTIFHPKTTLHDGGMILTEGRIEGAGCVFPVSQRELRDRSLGLRHRAALGITEQTDAIAVVVSEETGQISIAQAGQLLQSLTLELFKRRLMELLERNVQREEKAEADGRKEIVERPATKRLEA